MTETSSPADDRIVEAETRREFVTAGDHTVGAVTEKKTFKAAAEDHEDMPLPTDPKTIFLGGLFTFAALAVLYVASEIILPLILAVVLKILLQPLVRLLERVRIPRAIGGILTVLLVLLAFAGTITCLPALPPTGPASCRRRYRSCATVSACSNT